MSRQSSSFCLILPITRPQSLWNLKSAKKLQVNDKTETRDKQICLLKLQAAGINFEKLLG